MFTIILKLSEKNHCLCLRLKIKVGANLVSINSEQHIKLSFFGEGMDNLFKKRFSLQVLL